MYSRTLCYIWWLTSVGFSWLNSFSDLPLLGILEFWGMLVTHFVDCLLMGICLMFCSWLDCGLCFWEEDHTAKFVNVDALSPCAIRSVISICMQYLVSIITESYKTLSPRKTPVPHSLTRSLTHLPYISGSHGTVSVVLHFPESHIIETTVCSLQNGWFYMLCESKAPPCLFVAQ
jgi:hypothetical protein